MSPSSREINGRRPSPLKIHKDSHHIHKPSSSSSSSSATTQQQRHQPVIIYTQSPKIIHTHASDFMALVQKLTGLSRSPPPPSNSSASDVARGMKGVAQCNDSSSSSENSNVKDTHPSSSSSPPATVSLLGFDMPQANHLLSEIPLFTPTSLDFFCSPNTLYRYPESSMYSPQMINMGGSISPSLLEALKGIPEF